MIIFVERFISKIYVIKDFGNFFSRLAILDSGAGSIFHLYLLLLVLTIIGITPFIPAKAYLIAWDPTASAWAKSTFEAI